MPKLTDEHKEFIVTQLAMFLSPTAVSKAVREAYGIDVPKNQVEGYDPASYRARTGNISKRWIELHAAKRKAYLEETGEIAIAQRGYRLRRLQEMERKAFESGNAVLAAQLLKQAAKEAGNAFTNERRVKHDGKIAVEEVPGPDELRHMLAERLKGAFAATAATKH